jgi:hypothetical protein
MGKVGTGKGRARLVPSLLVPSLLVPSLLVPSLLVPSLLVPSLLVLSLSKDEGRGGTGPLSGGSAASP